METLAELSCDTANTELVTAVDTNNASNNKNRYMRTDETKILTKHLNIPLTPTVYQLAKPCTCLRPLNSTTTFHNSHVMLRCFYRQIPTKLTKHIRANHLMKMHSIQISIANFQKVCFTLRWKSSCSQWGFNVVRRQFFNCKNSTLEPGGYF